MKTKGRYLFGYHDWKLKELKIRARRDEWRSLKLACLPPVNCFFQTHDDSARFFPACCWMYPCSGMGVLVAILILSGNLSNEKSHSSARNCSMQFSQAIRTWLKRRTRLVTRLAVFWPSWEWKAVIWKIHGWNGAHWLCSSKFTFVQKFDGTTGFSRRFF